MDTKISRRVDYRTEAMMEGFMACRQQDMSFTEIANKFNVSPDTVYRRLQEIATQHNTDRDTLLYRPHALHSPFSSTVTKSNVPLDGSDLLTEIAELKTILDNLFRTSDYLISL